LFAIALATSKSAFLYFKAVLILALFMLIQRPSKLKSATHLDISSRRTVPRNYNPQPHKTHDATLVSWSWNVLNIPKVSSYRYYFGERMFFYFFKERGLWVFESRTRRFFTGGAEARLGGRSDQ
jgi:hypothetical protein